MNTFQEGIGVEEAWGYLPLGDGKFVHGGVPKTTPEELAKQDKYRGVPMPGPNLVPKGKVQLVSVAWLIGQAEEVKLYDKGLEDNESLSAWMDAGNKIPPIHITVTEEGNITLHDGHHRLLVAKSLGWKTIEAVVEGIMPTSPKCVATTKKGDPCKAYAQKNDAKCVGHNR